ncbi:hypothetical protein NDN08_006768 [Rhodosorus marinus]|uniref:Sodium/calcium exchanger membrane region domain-containing protein n=1 Tax=Rhodosorus marinus TaxID=101924 RepID=A0AAV8UIM7_9RHOD|nr:hypothetical protein NDN08_006768 [Rhodosorus marinus]
MGSPAVDRTEIGEASTLIPRSGPHGGAYVSGQSSPIVESVDQVRSSSLTSRISRTSDRYASMVIRRESTVSYGDEAYRVPLSLKYMLVFALIGAVARIRSWGPFPVFWFNALGLVPLGVLQNHFTKSLTNAKATGLFLFHTILRNAVEFAIAISSLYMAKYSVLKAFLLGSIVCNQLVVPGVHYVMLSFEGIEVEPDTEQLMSESSMLMLLICTSFVVPTAVSFSMFDQNRVLWLSRICACLLLGLYECILISEIPRLINRDEEQQVDSVNDFFEDEEIFYDAEIGARPAPNEMRPSVAAILLILTMTAMCFSCSSLVSSIDGAAMALRLPVDLLAFAALPFLGNTTEFVNVGISDAETRNSIENAVGSAILVGLLIYPSMVVVAWVFDRPFTFSVSLTEAVSVFMTCAISNYVYGKESTIWIKGTGLITAFLVFCVGVAFQHI